MTAINWKNGVSGDWSLNTNWNPASVPGAADAVTIAVASASPYTVSISVAEAANTLTLNQKNATVADQATLTMGGALTLTAGTFDLQGSGAIKGGALVMNGGTLLADGGTLDGVKVQGVFNLTQPFGSLVVKNGLTLTDKAGTGGGLLSLTGLGMSLNFAPGVQTLNSAVAGKTTMVNIGSTSGDTISQQNAGGTVTTTNFGSLISIVQVGQFATLTASTQVGDSLVNQGTIRAIQHAGTFTINGGAFVNQGALNVNNGDVLTINSSKFSNSGTVTVANASTLNIGQGGTWSSTGKVNVTDSTLNLLGTVTLAEVNAITRAGGLINLAGTMDIKGGTLNVGAKSNIGTVLLSGVIQNGTVHDGGLGLQYGTNSSPPPTLDGVTYQGVVDLSETQARLRVLNGLTMTGAGGTGAGTINLTGSSANLTLLGSQTLDKATLRIAGGASLNVQNNGSATAVTLGKDLTIKHAGTTSFSSATIQGSFSGSDSLTNQGTILAALRGGSFNISGGNAFTNDTSGTIAVSNGDNLSLSATTLTNKGVITGGVRDSLSISGSSTFSNQGSIGIGTGDTASVSAGNFVNAGSVSVANGATLDLRNSTTFTNTGSLNVLAGGTVDIGSSFGSWSNSGKITATSATVHLFGTLNQGQLSTITRTGGVLDIAGVLQNSGTTLSVGTGSTFGALTLTGSIVGGTIHDAGGGLLFAANTFQPATLDGVTYQGTLNLGAADTQVLAADGITLTGTAGTGLGAVTLTGSDSSLLLSGTQVLNNAMIKLGATGSAAVLGSQSSFFGPATMLTLGTGLTVQQTGQFAILQGATSASDLLINRGVINAGVAGGAFAVQGSSFGSLANAFSNQGVINVSNGDVFTILARSFSNTGTVNVTTGGTLSLGQPGSGSTPGGDWTSTGTIQETNATVILGGDVTLSEINSITRTGGTLVIGGRFDNTGATLKLGTGSTLGAFTLTGTIENGILNDAGGGLLLQNGTLDSLTYQGVVDLSASNASATIVDSLKATGVAGTGTGSIKLTGGGSALRLQGVQTLDNATVEIGGTLTATLSLSSMFLGTTTFGSKLVINQTGRLASLNGTFNSSDTLVEQGTINAGVSGGSFSIGGSSNFTLGKTGSLNVSNGDAVTISASNFVSSGTVTVTGGSLNVGQSFSGGGFTNNGMLSIGGGTVTIGSSSGNFNNTGTVTVTGGAVLNIGPSFFTTAFNWSNTGAGKISETDSTLNLGGAETLANLNAITRTGGTVALTGSADLGGGTLNVGTGSKLGALVLTGTISNGTIHDADPGIIFGLIGNGGTLDNVKYRGTMDLSTANARAIVMDNIDMASLDGTKRGTILLTGANSDLRFLGVQTLSKVNMSLGGTAGTSAMLEAAGLSSFLPAQLTLGSAVTITHTAGADASIGLAQITSSGFETPGVVINQGSIAAGLKGGTFFINGGSFDNQGKVTVSNGDVLTVNPSKFTNEGTVNVVTGATLNIGQSFGTQTVWSSTGTLSETNATIKLLGTVSLDNLNSITRSGGTVAVAGVANLGGGTLNVGTGTKLGALVLTGTITNGTVNDADPGVIFSGSAATLNGVKYQGTLDLSPASSRVTVLNGLPLSGLGGVGKATILDTGAGSLLETVGTTTLDNANMSLGGTGFSSATLETLGQLTLGANLNITHTGGPANITGLFNSGTSEPSSVINLGSITAMLPGGNFTIGGFGALSAFTNQKVINVGGGDTLSITSSNFTNSATGVVAVTTGGILNLGQAGTWSNAGKLSETNATINLFGSVTLGNLNSITRSGGMINFQAALNGSGGTLNVGTGTKLGTLQDTGTIANTIVHDTGNGLLFFGPPHSSGVSGAVLNAVTYQGVLNLAPTQSNLTVSGGLTLTDLPGTGAGVANLTGAASVLFASGTETFDNMTLNIGNTEALGSTLFQTDPTALGAVLTLGSKMTINQVGATANVVGARSLGDKIVNNGKIMANFAGGQFLVTEGAFVNNGSIIVGNGDTFTLDPDQLTNAGALVINKGGTLRVDGALAGGTVNFGDKSSGTLMLGTPGSVSTPMVGFGATDATHSDAIDLLNTAATGLSYSGTATSGVLTVTNAAAATVATLNFKGNYTTASFHLAPDGNGGTLILDPPVNANTLGAPAMQFIGGSSVVDASAGNQTLVLPAPGAAPETIVGFGLSNGDELDLHQALAGSTWNGDLGAIGNFVSISAGGGDTTISVDPTGHGGGGAVATLVGLDTNLDGLLAHHAIKLG